MARLRYANATNPENRQLAARITQQRGGIPHLYAMLMHSAPLTEGWLRFLTAIRQECALPADIRELTIMQIAALNDAGYEGDQHAPIALDNGLSQAQLDALPDWRQAGLFDERQRTALAYCDAMTRDVHVPDAVFDDLRRFFDERLTVELTATIAAYNMVSRFLEAVQIASGDDPAHAPD